MPPLTEEQQFAVNYFGECDFLLLQGGPGSGKTTTICSMLRKLSGSILLCAPTGCAAERLTKVTNYTAHTIDRLLSTRNLRRTYGGAAIILDEASMVNIDSLRQLLETVEPRKILIVGDERQLPCQEGYSSLPTLLRVSGLRKIRLTRNLRQNADCALARTIARLASWDGLSPFSPDTDDKFQIIPCATQTIATKLAADKFKEAKGKAQMLALTNEFMKELNKLTASGRREIEPGTSVGDRIVCTKNLYDKRSGTLFVANGVIGKVAGRNMIVYDNDYIDKRRPVHGFHSTFETARAMTVHKSQGNEFSETGIILLGGTREIRVELIYTALSRFKNQVFLIGTSYDVNKAFQGKFSASVDDEVIGVFRRKLKKRTHDD
jgi:exodeoxyribonuclease V alpha subunit